MPNSAPAEKLTSIEADIFDVYRPVGERDIDASGIPDFGEEAIEMR
jgi:hypothetical protein